MKLGVGGGERRGGGVFDVKMEHFYINVWSRVPWLSSCALHSKP